MSAEVWRRVPGWEDLYAVSDQGRMVSFHRKKPYFMACTIGAQGYPVVQLVRDKQGIKTAVHRVVARAFLGPRPADMETRHLDGNGANNTLSNLAYGTSSENEMDKVRHGTHQSSRKTHCPAGHPYAGENLRITPSGRACHTCSRKSRLAYYHRQAARRRNAA